MATLDSEGCETIGVRGFRDSSSADGPGGPSLTSSSCSSIGGVSSLRSVALLSTLSVPGLGVVVGFIDGCLAAPLEEVVDP